VVRPDKLADAHLPPTDALALPGSTMRRLRLSPGRQPHELRLGGETGKRYGGGTMDTPARGFPLGSIRVSDAERDLAVAELSQHYQAGRLTVEEFNDRAGQASEARTGDELHALFTDLPLVDAEPAVPAHLAPPQDALQPHGRLGPGRIVAVCIIGYIFGADAVSTIVNAADWGWNSALGTAIPTLIFGLIFLKLIWPALRPPRP
jgi:hypothetical protein